MAASGMDPHDTATLRRIKAGARSLGGGLSAHMSDATDDFLGSLSDIAAAMELVRFVPERDIRSVLLS